MYIFSGIFKKRELRGNMYSAKISTFTVCNIDANWVIKLEKYELIYRWFPFLSLCGLYRMVCNPYLVPLRLIINIDMTSLEWSWSGPQLPKGCGCIGFLSPMHKKRFQIPIQKEKGATPGILVYRLNNRW